MDPPAAGLCATCRNSKRIESARGSTFWLCQFHDRDPRYPKYPRLPVLRCGAYAAERPSREEEEDLTGSKGEKEQ